MKQFKVYPVLILVGLISSCGAYLNQPTDIQEPRTGEITKNSTSLRGLPLPKEPVVVGVYNFKDQTGQYKNVENGSTFSTAVPQGATTILIKALEDSKWFSPIERENLSNLLNERNIIRSTREEYRKNQNPNEPNLPPLLYAGILLEGGIISYDSNILTGGLGARYFGVGGSTQYRQDRITVYLRAVSTVNGKILKTVNVSKTILSQAVDASLFRYVKFQRLLEAETGFTKNEPIQLALQSAIEAAVENLIIEGVEAKLWGSAKGERADQAMVSLYNNKKVAEESTLLYDRKQRNHLYANGVLAGVSTPYLLGDYSTKKIGFGGFIAYKRALNPKFNMTLQGDLLKLKGGSDFHREFMSAHLDLEYVLLPYDLTTPYFYAGLGGLLDLHNEPSNVPHEKTSFLLRYGMGLKTRLNSFLDLHFFAEGNQGFTDTLDGVVQGTYNDMYLNFGIGLEYKFGSFLSK